MRDKLAAPPVTRPSLPILIRKRRLRWQAWNPQTEGMNDDTLHALTRKTLCKKARRRWAPKTPPEWAEIQLEPK